jgi:hypothetical protein
LREQPGKHCSTQRLFMKRICIHSHGEIISHGTLRRRHTPL